VRFVLAGDLQLEEVTSINTRGYKQLLFFVEVALINQTGFHVDCFHKDEVFIEDVQLEVRANYQIQVMHWTVRHTRNLMGFCFFKEVDNK